MGFFPPSSEKIKDCHEPTHSEAGWQNYASVEDDPAAEDEVKKLADSPYVDVYEDYASLLKWCTSEPIISKLKMVTKHANNKIKRRLIMDCLVSGVNGQSLQKERILLPRIADLIFDVLALMEQCVDDEVIHFMVLDFIDAFFRMPLNPDERHLYVVEFEGRFHRWNRIAQSSTNGPQLFGRLAALIGRLTQSTFDLKYTRMHI